MFRHESTGVYRALVADMARTLVPTSIMGLTFVIVNVFIWMRTGHYIILFTAVLGALATFCKISLIIVYNRCDLLSDSTLGQASRWETMHAMTTTVFSLSVGISTALLFQWPDLSIQMLGTATLCAYCAGLVARVGIRPVIASVALALAACPAIVSAAIRPDAPHRILAAMFTVFLFGAFDIVRHVHATAVRHIATRMDMSDLAKKDPLTGLLNRRGLQQAFDKASVKHNAITVHCLDLDSFKGVNDQFGHAGGDEVLQEVAHRLRVLSPGNTAVARIGGDEFVVLQWGEMDAKSFTQLMLSVLTDPFTLEGRAFIVSASIGYSSYTSGNSLDTMMRLADEGSYRIKRGGGGFASHREPR